MKRLETKTCLVDFVDMAYSQDASNRYISWMSGNDGSPLGTNAIRRYPAQSSQAPAPSYRRYQCFNHSFMPVTVEVNSEGKTLKFNNDPEEDPNKPSAKTCRRYVKAVSDAIFEVTIVLSNHSPLPKEKARCQTNRGFILHDSDAHRQYALAGSNHQWHITPSLLPPGHAKLQTCSFLYFAITSTYPLPFFPFLTVPPFLA